MITISGIIRSIRKTSTTALNPQRLKAKYIEWDISLIKNYCITISMLKIRSIHQFNLKIQQILGSHKIMGYVYPKINQIDHTHFLLFRPKKLLIKIKFFWIGLNMEKIRLFHWFILEIWFFYKYYNLIGREHFGPYPRNKISTKYRLCTETR